MLNFPTAAITSILFGQAHEASNSMKALKMVISTSQRKQIVNNDKMLTHTMDPWYFEYSTVNKSIINLSNDREKDINLNCTFLYNFFTDTDLSPTPKKWNKHIRNLYGIISSEAFSNRANCICLIYSNCNAYLRFI